MHVWIMPSFALPFISTNLSSSHQMMFYAKLFNKRAVFLIFNVFHYTLISLSPPPPPLEKGYILLLNKLKE